MLRQEPRRVGLKKLSDFPIGATQTECVRKKSFSRGSKRDQ
jgi:hypothetical protein